MAKRAFQLLYVLLLLVAQQGALTHQIWHLRGSLPAQEHHDYARAAQQNGGDERSPQSGLCDLHFALGTLLAGDCPGQPAVALPDLSDWLMAAPVPGRIAQPAEYPRSRSPPVLL